MDKDIAEIKRSLAENTAAIDALSGHIEDLFRLIGRRAQESEAEVDRRFRGNPAQYSRYSYQSCQYSGAFENAGNGAGARY